MKIVMMVTADYAAVEPQTGKINIIGVFRNINTSKFPTTHPRMYLVIVVAGEMNESPNPHRMSVSMLDEDGKVIASFESAFELPSGTPGISPEHRAVIELNGVVFPDAGDYVFEVNIDDGLGVASTVVQVAKRTG